MRQFVPDKGNGDWGSSIADNRQSCVHDGQSVMMLMLNEGDLAITFDSQSILVTFVTLGSTCALVKKHKIRFIQKTIEQVQLRVYRPFLMSCSC